jgi:16S rRNA (cytosine1402-N4)-methyltransferase
MSEFVHTPVLVSDVQALLDPQPGNIIIDATLGLGGHAESMLAAMNGQGKLIGVDQDDTAISLAHDRLKSFASQFVTVRGNFRDIDELVRSSHFESADRILFDLGVSSLQLDDGSRGFSFKFDAPLDMRMDTTQAITAADILRTYTEEELAQLFTDLGEEPRAKIIAGRIASARTKKPIETTGELVAVVGGKFGRIHPATRVFQALRMQVNDELGAIAEALPKALELLTPGGRMAVITFHSLEDRLVKQLFKTWEQDEKVRLINKKVVQAKWEEKKNNPRARSAKLRVIEKI